MKGYKKGINLDWKKSCFSEMEQNQVIKREKERLIRSNNRCSEEKLYLSQENKRLREALDFYANEMNYTYQDAFLLPIVAYDNGEKARQALEESE